MPSMVNPKRFTEFTVKTVTFLIKTRIIGMMTLEDFRRLEAILGHPPTQKEVREQIKRVEKLMQTNLN